MRAEGSWDRGRGDGASRGGWRRGGCRSRRPCDGDRGRGDDRWDGSRVWVQEGPSGPRGPRRRSQPGRG
ncbi:MAG: hypothetical protein EDX89_24475 [Acidobacteria bacterium]|nr:MAG: hypothetical protein EDX89_24475 [Acidobacteriota bacterium]